MPSAAIDSLGISFSIGGTVVAEVKDFEGHGLSTSFHDVSNHQTSSGYEEVIPAGLQRNKNIKFTINYIPSNATHNASATGLVGLQTSQTKFNWSLIWPDAATTWSGAGYIAEFMPKAPVDGVLEADVEIKPTGALTLS